MGCNAKRKALLRSGGAAALAMAVAPVPAFAQTQTYELDIPAMDLGDALRTFARATRQQVVFSGNAVRNRRSTAIRGNYTARAALDEMTAGAGVSIDVGGGGIFMVRPADGGAGGSLSTGDSPVSGEIGAGDAPADSESTAIVVTGTTIRGANVPSRLITITPEEMRQAGHNNLGEAVRALPQNFAGGQNPGIAFGAIAAGGNESANFTGSSSLNLRGLGPDATLTLLNGARLPYDGLVQATDVASIPIAAIERLEILLDGASAIYGSDAVGGVANIILRRDFDGVDLNARYGLATDGGYGQVQLGGVAGTRWGSGGFMVTADYIDQDSILARQRDYLGSVPLQDIKLVPDFVQASFVFSGHQAITENIELSLDAFYTDRDSADRGVTVFIFDSQRDSAIWGITPAARIALPRDWSLRLHGGYGVNDSRSLTRASTLDGTPLEAIDPILQLKNTATNLGGGLEGPLFGLLDGRARVSIGGGLRRARFEQRYPVSIVTEIRGETDSRFAYGELNLPIVEPRDRMPFVHRLTLSGAVRYEDYKTVGAETTPRLGLIWGPIAALDLKATWGESFKVPTLNQHFAAPSLFYFPTIFFPGLPAEGNVIFAGGGNPQLSPERAEVFTAGIAFRPTFLSGFTLEIGYFDIDYSDRIIRPSTNDAANPAFGNVFTLNPSVAQQTAFFDELGFPVGTFTSNGTGQPYDPATVAAILDTRFTNASFDKVRGFDVIGTYTTDLFGGRFTLTGNGSWFNAKRRLTVSAPELVVAGTAFFPAKFKGRLQSSWSADGFTIYGAVNHVAGVRNTNIPTQPMGRGMTTLDVVVDYRFEDGPLEGFGFNLAVNNVLDEPPPFLQPAQPFFVPFDSTNYSAIGRTVSLALSMRF